MYPTFIISQIIRSDGDDLVSSKSNYHDFIFKRSTIITTKLFRCIVLCFHCNILTDYSNKYWWRFSTESIANIEYILQVTDEAALSNA